jgi:hypothetical protein
MRFGRTTAALTVAACLAACAPSTADEAADLCGDLESFAATFELLLRPPEDAALGEVRGALEKVAPFLGRLADADATTVALDDELEAVQERFRDGLDGLGDDEPASVADAGLASARPRLAAALGDAAVALGCGDFRVTPEATV